MKYFQLNPWTIVDKELVITGPGDFKMIINFDNVNCLNILDNIKKLLKILNTHWAK